MAKKMNPQIRATIKNYIKHALHNKGATDYESGIEPSDLLQMFYSVPRERRKDYGRGHAWTTRLGRNRLGRIIHEIPYIQSEKHFNHWDGRLVTRYYLSDSFREHKN